jgi:hypothetical protein
MQIAIIYTGPVYYFTVEPLRSQQTTLVEDIWAINLPSKNYLIQGQIYILFNISNPLLKLSTWFLLQQANKYIFRNLR